MTSSAMAGRWLAALGGRIYTMDATRPMVEALLARDGRILLVGSNDEVEAELARLPSCDRLDLGGRAVVPGFHDSHIHALAFGLSLERVALAGVESLEEVLARVATAARAAPKGRWVLGWGWDHSLWRELGGRFPDKHLLDRAAAGTPVALRRKDGHLLWLNSAALSTAGITRQTPDPPGGRIGRFDDGEPNGLLFEGAIELAERAIPSPSLDEARRVLQRVQEEAHRLGITAIQVPEGRLTFEAFQVLEASGELRLRVTMLLPYDTLDALLATGVRSGFGGARLRVGGIKLFMDGSLGSQTAALLAPFEGSAGNTGLLTMAPDEARAAIERAARGGLACAVHAIGDRANRLVLDAFEATREIWRPVGLRQRIEHVQLLHPDDLPRLARIGVIASMQPIHATQDMDLVDRLWGARGRYAYAFASLLRSGTTLAFGSDAPVETPDPLAGLYAAVARRRPDGRPAGGWYPEERIDLQAALHAYTVGAGRAAGRPPSAGTLAPGQRADFVVLSRDLLREPPEALLETRVDATVFDGAVVYAREP